MRRAAEESSHIFQREFWPCTRLNRIAIKSEQNGDPPSQPKWRSFLHPSSFLSVLCVKALEALTFAFTPHRAARILKIYVGCERQVPGQVDGCLVDLGIRRKQHGRRDARRKIRLRRRIPPHLRQSLHDDDSPHHPAERPIRPPLGRRLSKIPAHRRRQKISLSLIHISEPTRLG